MPTPATANPSLTAPTITTSRPCLAARAGVRTATRRWSTTRFDYGVFYGLNCYDADARLAPHLAHRHDQTRAVHRRRALNRHGRYHPRADRPRPVRAARLSVKRRSRRTARSTSRCRPTFRCSCRRSMIAAWHSTTCGWIWVKPKETRGCIGCHEDPERIPENEYVLALRRPSNRLLLPPDPAPPHLFPQRHRPAAAATLRHGGLSRRRAQPAATAAHGGTARSRRVANRLTTPC